MAKTCRQDLKKSHFFLVIVIFVVSAVGERTDIKIVAVLICTTQVEVCMDVVIPVYPHAASFRGHKISGWKCMWMKRGYDRMSGVDIRVPAGDSGDVP